MTSADDKLLTRPIIIVGAPRSGTTILGRILSHHPHLAYADEPRLTWRYGNDGKSDLLRPEDARPAVINHVRAALARTVADAGKSRLLEKTPSNALRLPFVDRVFPDARYLHITRHGVDSVLSIHSFWQKHATGMTGLAPGRLRQRLKEVSLRRLPYYTKEAIVRLLPGGAVRGAWGPRLPGIDRLLRELDLLEVCCLQWRMCTELATQFGRTLPPDRYLECRLEDMSPQTLQRITTFCELEPSAAVSDYFNETFRPGDAARRKADADPATVRHILDWIEPTLRWLGYDVGP